MEQVSSDKGSGLPEVWQTYQTIIKTAVGTEVTDVAASYYWIIVVKLPQFVLCLTVCTIVFFETWWTAIFVDWFCDVPGRWL